MVTSERNQYGAPRRPDEVGRRLASVYNSTCAALGNGADEHEIMAEIVRALEDTKAQLGRLYGARGQAAA